MEDREVANRIYKVIETYERTKTRVKRRRVLRDSEKAMQLADIDETIRALIIAHRRFGGVTTVKA